MNRFLILTVLSTALVSCADKTPDASREDLMEASRQELAAALEERDRLLVLVKEISEGMDEIKRLENIMSISGPRRPRAVQPTTPCCAT